MTNAAAIGYMIMSAKEIGLKEEMIKELERMMEYMMDIKTEEKAEEVYRSY
ncbi:MAG: hypothetical protein ACPLRZ_11645 [Thermovenabulum sp.]|uniref:hypothetical protein n=1 Tax=Thermovenabulum sp. TaxID=3100335 RepID=UPI003C7C5C68